MRHSIGRNKAIELANTEWWKAKSAKEICSFQFSVEELCMDFGVFHAATEKSLERPVFTHEFVLSSLYEEVAQKCGMLSYEEVMSFVDATIP